MTEQVKWGPVISREGENYFGPTINPEAPCAVVQNSGAAFPSWEGMDGEITSAQVAGDQNRWSFIRIYRLPEGHPAYASLAPKQTQICANCHWWKSTYGVEGDCLRFPPAASQKHGQRGNWPVTFGGDRCGEWKEREG